MVRRPNIVLTNKKGTFYLVDVVVPADLKVKRWRNTWIWVEKSVENEVNGNNNCSWYPQSQDLKKECRSNRDQMKKRDHRDDSSVKISSGTKKNSGDMKGLVVIQTSVKNHQSELVWKTCQEYNNHLLIYDVVAFVETVSWCSSLQQLWKWQGKSICPACFEDDVINYLSKGSTLKITESYCSVVERFNWTNTFFSQRSIRVENTG